MAQRKKVKGNKKGPLKPANQAAGKPKKTMFDPSLAALRKNKEYLELKRTIALKGKTFCSGTPKKTLGYNVSGRQRKLENEARKDKPEKPEDGACFYVDRDRAAAVVIGNKDIKSDLRVWD